MIALPLMIRCQNETLSKDILRKPQDAEDIKSVIHKQVLITQFKSKIL